MDDIILGPSIVVSAHNSGSCLREALQQLVQELDRDGAGVIIVGNGPPNDTREITEELVPDSWGFPIRIFRSEVGLGTTYLRGTSRAKSEVVFLTASDLPPGVTDIHSRESVGDPSALVIGSKAHPGSVVPRSKLRTVMSQGYRFLRRVIPGMMVEDYQRALFVNRTWLQRHIPLLREHGYLTSAEIAHLAQVNRRRVVEVPIVLQAGHERDGTRIRIVDVRDIVVGLVRLRRRRYMLRVALKES